MWYTCAAGTYLIHQKQVFDKWKIRKWVKNKAT